MEMKRSADALLRTTKDIIHLTGYYVNEKRPVRPFSNLYLYYMGVRMPSLAAKRHIVLHDVSGIL
jgi:hypothetical protein